MSEAEMRKDIETLLSELKAIRSELSIRYVFIKDDVVEGIKIVAIAAAVLIGLKIAIKIVRVLAGFLMRHKLGLAMASGLCYLGWRNFSGKNINKQY